jgi:hypothetical protein
MAEESDDLTDALETVTRYILDNEVPECDYIMSQRYNHINVLVENLSMLSQPLLRFKNAIRKVMVLNRRRELRGFKLFELIMTIRQLKRKMAYGIASQLEVTSRPTLSGPIRRLSNASGLPTQHFHVVSRRESAANMPSTLNLGGAGGGAPPPRKKSSAIISRHLFEPHFEAYRPFVGGETAVDHTSDISKILKMLEK